MLTTNVAWSQVAHLRKRSGARPKRQNGGGADVVERLAEWARRRDQRLNRHQEAKQAAAAQFSFRPQITAIGRHRCTAAVCTSVSSVGASPFLCVFCVQSWQDTPSETTPAAPSGSRSDCHWPVAHHQRRSCAWRVEFLGQTAQVSCCDTLEVARARVDGSCLLLLKLVVCLAHGWGVGGGWWRGRACEPELRSDLCVMYSLWTRKVKHVPPHKKNVKKVCTFSTHTLCGVPVRISIPSTFPLSWAAALGSGT